MIIPTIEEILELIEATNERSEAIKNDSKINEMENPPLLEIL